MKGVGKVLGVLLLIWVATAVLGLLIAGVIRFTQFWLSVI